MEKLLPVFLRFVTFLAIVLTKWFHQRIHPFAYLRRLWSWRSMLQSTLLLLAVSCADNVYAQIKAKASLSKGTAAAVAANGKAFLDKSLKKADLSPQQKEATQKALQKQNVVLRFEQNEGQLGNLTVRFKAKDAQATYFFSKNEIRTVINGKKDSLQAGYALQFVDASPDAAIAATEKISNTGATNYLTEGGSFANVASYSKLNYSHLWQGVDASFYESEGTMKYDFIVQPNADPTQVRLKMDGTTDLKINAKGELEFTTPFGTLQKGKPYTYQTVNGKKVEITSAYILNDKGEIAFQLGDYDRSLPLVIDPIALKWSTFLMPNTSIVNGIYVHPTTGRIYLTGTVTSTGFPSTLGRTYADGGADAYITCMEKDGTSLVWSTYFGGSGYDVPNAISVDAAGDVFVTGATNSADFPVNGSTAAYDSSPNGSLDMFIIRLNSTGSTLKYGTFLGGSGDDGASGIVNNGEGILPRNFVLTNGTVYAGLWTFGNDFPTTAGAYQSSSAGTVRKAIWLALNTNVGGPAGLEYSTYFAHPTAAAGGAFSGISGMTEDKDGNLWFVGFASANADFPISANAIQKYSDLQNAGNFNFIAKFTKGGQYLYSSVIAPFWSGNAFLDTRYTPSIDVDAKGNIYVGTVSNIIFNGGDPAQADLINDLKIAPNITNLYQLTPLANTQYNFNNFGRNYNMYNIGSVLKINYDLSPKYDFVSIFPTEQIYAGSDPDVHIDRKGNIHLLIHGALNGSNGGQWSATNSTYAFTAGAISTDPGFMNASIYYVLPPSGNSLLYGTVVSPNTTGFQRKFRLFVNNKCEAYITAPSVNSTFPITPTYRDTETNSQKAVYNATNRTLRGLTVFHEPVPNNNTIPDFTAGNNTFCVDGAIWQNPNDGPILGSTPTYVSGDGSSPTHNLPNMNIGAHPTPASPALQYQWQKSLNGGTNWINVGNGTYEVYKPSPEPSAGTVQYRRIIVGLCTDTLSISNVATATIAGNFTLQIATPIKPVYYCPTVAGTDLGVSVTGASGNISWQWYDGFSPLSGDGIISPASGTGTQASFVATVGTLVSGSGFYRLVITDAGGCRKEAFVSISPKTADAGPSPTLALCPGTVISVKLGPTAINPDFDYSWTGPGGFTSTLANPVVSTAGTYTLQVKLRTDATFCAPGTSVVVTASTPFASVLTDLTNKAFCQDDTPAAIGLTGAIPSGYVFQWVPGTNLDNQQAFSPVYDPGNVPGGPPVGTTNYTFTALRLSDGCVFERTMTVTNTALAFAFGGSDRMGDGCSSGTLDGVGGPETTGLYFQWTAIKTDFAAGLAALKANAAFGMDALGQQMGTNKFLNAKFPLCSVNGNVGYYIDYELKASYIPFDNNCFTTDTVRVFVPCCGVGPSCPTITSNLSGTTGACGGATTTIGVPPIQGATYTWTTYSINGVVQPAGTAPKGLFVNNNGVKGAALSAGGSHPATVIVDFDDASWGWAGNNVVVYEITQNYDSGNGVLSCSTRQQVFSGLNGTPKIGVLDLSLCTIPLPGVRVGTSGKAGPYQLTGANFTQAPNSAFTWSWSGGAITNGGTTPFPTVNPTNDTKYFVTVLDAATGCIAKDTLLVKVKAVIANAGPDLADICPGSLVQLGTEAQAGLTYSWSPSAGLNFPIGTPNSTVAQPYLTVPGPAPATLTYTLNVTDTETGCQAADNMTIGVTSTPPPAIAAASYNGCANGMFNIGPDGSLTGATYAWTVQSGTADLGWLSSTSVRQPVLTLPAGFTGPAVFRLTVTKGTCGSVFADYTINNNNPTISLGGPYTATCTSPFIQIGETALAGYSYSWSPYSGLYSDNTLATAYTGENIAQPWVRPTATTTYTVTRKNDVTGCLQTANVVVNPPAGVAANAGPDKTWCPGSPAIPIGASGSGTLTWTAVGYVADLSAAVPTAIASPMTSGQMLGYLSGTSGASVNFVQSTVVSGQYVYLLTSTSGGCSVSDLVVVKVSPVLPTGIAGLGQNVCPGGTVRLGASTNPTSYNYLWTALNPSNAGATIDNPTSSRPYVTPTVNTTYQVTYTNASTGCSADEQVTVVVNPKPVIADVTVPIVCKPITAQNLTSLIADYATLVNPVWYKDQYPGGVVITTPTAVAISKTTTYYLVAENTFGCKDTAMVVINIANPTTPDITPSGSINCTTRTFDLTSIQGSPSVAGNTLEWHSANNTNANTLITNTMVGVGKYYLFEKAASPANCYSASDSITVSSNCPAVCKLTLKPTVSGCYQNSGSKATVSIEVAWENVAVNDTANNASDSITVTFGGQTKTINPGAYTSTGGNGTIVSPQVVAFELPADASTQTAQAFVGASYAASTCKVEQTGIVLPAACPPTVCEAGQTGGTVWNDFNTDGIKQPGETTGLAGITVKAYDCNGKLVGTAITDVFGKYVFTGLTAASYPIRVEFTNLPTFAGQGTMNGTDGRTTTQFVNSADCNVDLGVLDPTDYCQTNPKLVIPCYVNGDPLATISNDTTSAGSADAVVSFDYNTSGQMNMSLMAHTPASQVGSLWGMAYNKFTKKIFSAATVKRHAGLGPLGLGGIYIADFSTVPANGATFNYTNFLDVSTIGINVGTIANNTDRGLVEDKTLPSIDNQGYLATGKVGIGGIDLSEDGNKLYLTNLFDNKLYEIDITAYNASGTLPTAANVKPYDVSTGISCTGGDLRIWAVKVRKGKVYTGMICDAGISQDKSDLRAFVRELNGATVSTIFDFPLTYPKGYVIRQSNALDRTGWYPWTDDWTIKNIPGQGGIVHPEPIFSAIEFDIDGSMVLAFSDRTGFQSGFQNLNPNGDDGRNYSGYLGGDILRAYSNGVSFVLENNAKAGPNIGYGPDNNQGPGFGEFYNDNWVNFQTSNFGFHAENVSGGLALRPGSGEVIVGVMDPVDYPLDGTAPTNTYLNSGGIRRLNNQTGILADAYQVYATSIERGTFSKSVGLGDIVLICDTPTYLEIGNRVWNDANKDGVQDPCEKVLTGVNVSVYKGTTLIATTKTDINGEYYFSTKSKIGTGTWSGTGADTTLLPTTGYKLVFGTGQTTGAALTVAGLGQFILTVKDATANNGNDQNDSDAEVVSGAFCINLTTGALASVNHTFDVGFVCTNPAIGNKITQTAPTCNALTPNNNGKLTLTAAVTPYDKYRVKTGTAAWSGDTTYATATAIGSTFPVDLVTTAPNAGATYVVRFYTGECCYKDTIITVLPTSCVVGSIGDYVWKDANRNGKQDGSETGVNGVQVILWSATTTGTPVAKLDSMTTAGAGANAGKYLFSNLPKGDYVVQFVKSTIPAECSGFTAKDTTAAGTTDKNDSDADKVTGITAKVTLDPKVLSGTSTPADSLATNNLTIDAGLVAPQGSLGDFVWKDTNNNGIQDETTPNAGGVAGVQIELYKNGTLFAKDTTDATGKYLFSNLDAGTYKIKVLSASIPAGCEISSVKDAPSDDAKDSDVDKTTGESGNYVIDPLDPTKKDILTVDAALYSPKGSLGDFVWKDINNNGIQDETTPNAGGVAGVQIELYKNGTFFAKDTTDATGHYLFSNLDAGTYKIKVLSASIPAGCEISSVKDAPSDDAKDSDVDKTTGESGNYVIDPLDPTKKDILTVDAGLAVPCVKSTVTLTGAPVCSADVQTYSLTFSVTNKVGIVKVNQGILIGSNPYTVTGIPSGATVKITDSLSAICKSDTLITGPNCNCNPPTPVLITQSLTACIGDTFPTIKATVVGLATVEWFATSTSTAVLFTGLNYKPAGNVTAAGATFYAQARSTDPTCPAAISTSRVMATVNAQNCTVEVDLALKKSINTKIAQIGDVLTYTLKVWNESSTNATGVEVVDSIATTVQFQAGSFTASRGTATITGNVIKWVIGNIAANGDTVTLTYRIKATQEGVHFNTAEICKTNEKDVDSTPCNHDDDEDDIDRQCFSVPVKLCPGEKAEVNVPANLTNVQWFKNGGTTAIGSGNVILLSEVGTYTFTATNQTCPANGCCPIIIEPGINCCPEDLCIPFTIKQTKKGKK